MTLLELVKHLRENILDDTGGQGVDWTGFNKDDYDSIQLRWTNEELVANINFAIESVYRRTNLIIDALTLDVEIGVPTYSLPTWVIEVDDVKREDGNYLIKKGMKDLYSLTEFNTKTGELKVWMPDDVMGSMRVYPIPEKNETLSMIISRLPKLRLTWDNPDISPEIREEYLYPMLFGAAEVCYLKDEANTYDPKRSQMFSDMFDAEFPFTSAYSNIRKRKTANRPIRYGGVGQSYFSTSSNTRRFSR